MPIPYQIIENEIRDKKYMDKRAEIHACHQPWFATERQAVASLLTAGFSQKQVSGLLNSSPQSVQSAASSKGKLKGGLAILMPAEVTCFAKFVGKPSGRSHPRLG
jgi:hypothetical protein